MLSLKKQLKFKQGIRRPGLSIGLRSWFKVFIYSQWSSLLQTPGFFFFCTLVHRSALDFEPGTKGTISDTLYKSYLEMLPKWMGKTNPIPHMNGRHRQGRGKGREKRVNLSFVKDEKTEF